MDFHTIWADYHGDKALVMDVTDKTGYGVFEDQDLIVRRDTMQIGGNRQNAHLRG